MTIFQIIQLINRLINFYELLICVYVLLSWFPIRQGGVVYDIGMVLARVCEPYLGLFRRFIPSFGGIDFTPVIAIVVLNVIGNLLYRLLI